MKLFAAVVVLCSLTGSHASSLRFINADEITQDVKGKTERMFEMVDKPPTESPDGTRIRMKRQIDNNIPELTAADWRQILKTVLIPALATALEEQLPESQTNMMQNTRGIFIPPHKLFKTIGIMKVARMIASLILSNYLEEEMAEPADTQAGRRRGNSKRGSFFGKRSNPFAYKLAFR